LSFALLLPIHFKEEPSFLNTCFESINQQSLLPSELTLIEDGVASIELKPVINKWVNIFASKGLKINHIFIEINSGLPNALNKGISQTESEIILRMDSDDFVANNRFQIQYEYLLNNPQVDIVGGYLTEFFHSPDEKNQRMRMVPTVISKNHDYIYYRNPFNHVTVAYRKSSILKLGGYDTQMQNFEDYDLWLRAINSDYRCINLPIVLCHSRIHPEFFVQRMGMHYLKKEKRFFSKQSRQYPIIGLKVTFIWVARMLTRLLPLTILAYIYNHLLREYNSKSD
jgi:glycosyltransferase involved in cell wall biosynthesis